MSSDLLSEIPHNHVSAKPLVAWIERRGITQRQAAQILRAGASTSIGQWVRLGTMPAWVELCIEAIESRERKPAAKMLVTVPPDKRGAFDLVMGGLSLQATEIEG